MERMTLRTIETAIRGKILRGHPELELAGISTDTRTLRPGELFFALRGDHHDAHDLLGGAAGRGAAAAVVHKDDAPTRVADLPLVLVGDTTRALGDLAHWHRKRCPTTVIAISGSNGKTTAKEMLFHILDGVVRSVKSIANFNNAVGVPLTLFQIRPQDVYAVVEIGTSAPGEMARLCEVADPDIGLITNITESHLEGLGDVAGVAREKAALLKHAAKRTAAFYNADDFWSRRVAQSVRGTLGSFGFENRADLRAFNPRTDRVGTSFKVMGGPRIRIPTPGAHNASNALAAVAVARKLGLDWGTIADRLATFRLPPQRMEMRTVAGVTVINDAYNANPVSMEAAARALSRMDGVGRKILVLADMLELGEQARALHRRVGETVAGFRPDYLFGFGRHAADLLASAREHGMNEAEVYLARSKERLAEALLAVIEPGDTVLFKGSRAMKLEEAVALLEQGLGMPAAGRSQAPVYGLYRSTEEDAARTGRRTSAARTVG